VTSRQERDQKKIENGLGGGKTEVLEHKKKCRSVKRLGVLAGSHESYQEKRRRTHH